MVPLTGKIIDDETKSPVSTKLTILVKDFSVLEIATNEDGEFVTSIPESNECKIVVHAKGFEEQDDVVTLALNASHYVEIHLIPFVKLVMEGEVISEKDKQPLNAELKIYRNTDFTEEDDKVITSGRFSEPLTGFGFYIIDFSAKGFVDVIDTVWVLNCHRKMIHKNFELTPIQKGLTIQLRNIYFNFGKTSFSSSSFTELDRLVEFFSQNPTMQVEIAGHTDSDGPEDYNQFLSQTRAQEVVDYLKSKGVSSNQLIAKGYGETKPIDTNSTLTGKANNRRVEMIVTKD
jgi:outer membrane protein OmpA-like peptidoglycan-associated protein